MENNKTKNELYAEKWLAENGFIFEPKKKYYSKTKYRIEKNGISDSFELPAGVDDIKQYMKMYGKNFAMLEELKLLKQQLTAAEDYL